MPPILDGVRRWLLDGGALLMLARIEEEDDAGSWGDVGAPARDAEVALGRDAPVDGARPLLILKYLCVRCINSCLMYEKRFKTN